MGVVVAAIFSQSAATAATADLNLMCANQLRDIIPKIISPVPSLSLADDCLHFDRVKYPMSHSAGGMAKMRSTVTLEAMGLSG